MSVLAEATMEMGDIAVTATRKEDGTAVTINSPDVVFTEAEARWLFQIGGPTVLYRTEPEPQKRGRR